MIISVPVQIADGPSRGDGTPVPILVGVQMLIAGSKRLPLESSEPPQTIISLPVHNAAWSWRADGTGSPLLVGTQLLLAGSYRPPVFRDLESYPPHTIISAPVQTAV